MTTDTKAKLQIRDLIWIFFIILFASVLFSFIYKGFFSRYLQDDYCYGAMVSQNGFFHAQYLSYFIGGAYNGNRYALTLFSGIVDVLGGPSIVGWLPAFWIIVWGISLSFLFKNIVAKVGGTRLVLPAILFAEIILTFAFFIAPETFQVLYWKAGSLPYLAPLVLNTYLLARLSHISGNKAKAVHFIEFLLIGLLAAGFSETTAVVQFALWGLILLLNLFWKKSAVQNKNLNLLIGTVLLVTTCGLLLLAFSPANMKLLTLRPAKPITLVTFVSLSLRFGLDFITDSLKSRWLPFFVLFCTGVAAGLNIKLVLTKNKLLMLMGVVIVSLYIICVAASTPSVLLGSVYPENRALFPSHTFLVLALFALGLLSAQLAASLKWMVNKEKMFQIISLVICVGIIAYMVRKLPVFYDGISSLRGRAAAWDQRQEYIFSEIKAGKTQLIVPAFDSIGRLPELQVKTTDWINVCAASYYGVESISAQENYNGVKPWFQ